ncbi:MAG: c-type cytochrome [Nitrospinota bacterium]
MSPFTRTALLWGGLLLGAAAVPAPARAQHAHPPQVQVQTKAAPPADSPMRMTMEELHKHGGVPPAWKFQVPPGDAKEGRETFVTLECFACHRVQGESFPRREAKPDEKGPDLTGMGARHPAEYLFESILHPNRVIVSDPGFTGKDNLSIMPSYNHLLTLEDAVNLTAYLKGLTAGGRPSGAAQPPGGDRGHGQTSQAAPPAPAPAGEGAPSGPPPVGPGEGPFTELRVRGGKLAAGPKVLRVKQGDTVRLRFAVDKAMELHLHGYNIERKAKPDAPAEMVFRARAAGRFPVEGHAEGAQGGGHGHGGEGVLLYLEVHPR